MNAHNHPVGSAWAAAVSLILLGSAAMADPRPADDRLVIELFAEHPDIVTPVHIDVDRDGRVWAVESHTHFRPDDYDGPAADRIRVYQDTSGDGTADRATTFHEGLEHAMDIALARDGSVYVATRARIVRLRDTNGDGKADDEKRIVTLDTTGTYPHNGLSGLAFDFHSDLYFGLGENLGHAYTLIGADGVRISGGGEGGSAYHVAPDGTGLRRVATGFWNPFGMTVDVFGRLFATDNDPDSSPPCRLLHIVEGGDYGYEYRYGRSGLHPLVTWHGDLPGTLPMASGIGEGAGAVLAYESDAFPAEYRGQLLVAAWADNRIERFEVEPRGASVTATRHVLVEGGERFRPVGLATAPDGSVYISDWVDPSYSLHRQGRIWRLRPREMPEAERPADPRDALHSADRLTREDAARQLTDNEAGRAYLRARVFEADDARVRAAAVRALIMVEDRETDFKGVAVADRDAAVRDLAVGPAVRYDHTRPSGFFGLREPHPPAVRAAALRHLDHADHAERLLEHLEDDDPFIRHAAIETLRADAAAVLADVKANGLPEGGPRRVGVLLALKRSGIEGAPDLLLAFLGDADEEVRLAAVKWVADEKLDPFRPRVEAVLDAGDLTWRLFRAASAALDRLDGQPPKDNPSPNELFRIVTDDNAPPAMRRLALRMIDPEYHPLNLRVLRPLLEHEEEKLRLEAVRTLRGHPDERRNALLIAIASDDRRSVAARAEAILGLAHTAAEHADLLVELACSGEPALRHEALRALIGAELGERHRERLEEMAEAEPSAADAVARAFDAQALAAGKPPADNLDAWIELIGSADAADTGAGERIFFHPKVGTCSACHTLAGRGERVGPDLTRIGRGADHRRLLESILQPSRRVAPEYQPWLIETTEGEAIIALALRKGPDAEHYRDAEGREVAIPRERIARTRELTTSLMPDHLAQQLTPDELRDLLAFLLHNR